MRSLDVHLGPCELCGTWPHHDSTCSLWGLPVQAQLALLAVHWSLSEVSLPGCTLCLSDGGTVLYRGPKVSALLHVSHTI